MATLVYSTDNYKTFKKKHFNNEYVPTGIIKSNKTANNPNHPLFEAKKACTMLKRIALTGGSHIFENQLIKQI